MTHNTTKSKIIAKSRNIEITLETNPMVMSSEQTTKVDSVWESATKKNPNLFNGHALIYVSHNVIEDRIHINVRRIDYKYVFASLLHPELKLDLHPIAVSGIVIDNSSNSIMGLRHKSVTQYPEFYELIPAGGIKPDKIKEDKKIDFIAQLVEEFEQEAGLKKKCIQSIIPLGLIYEPYHRIYVIACSIKLNTDLSSDKLNLNKNEYSSYKIISLKDLEETVLRDSISFVPTSRLIIEELCFKDNNSQPF